MSRADRARANSGLSSRNDGGVLLEAPPSCRWTLITDAQGRGGTENMAIDQALLQAVRPGIAFLRLYRWAPPCLSFGRNEPAQQRYRRDRIEEAGLEVVRRPTGGRAVWHDREVTYAVAAPTDVFGALRAAYITIHQMLANALRSLGAPVSVAEERPALPLNAGACFGSPVGGEIVHQGRKLVGSAQYREPHAFLQHGSILLENGQDIVREVSRDRMAPIPATSLEEVVGHPVTFEQTAAAITRTAMEHWEGPWERATHEPVEDAVRRFQDPAWTWLR